MERNIQKELNETIILKSFEAKHGNMKVDYLNGDAKVDDQVLAKIGDIIRVKMNEDMQIKV